MDSIKKITGYLKGQDRSLVGLLHKIAVLKEKNTAVLKYLSPQIHPYCQVANITGSTLIMIAANGSVATQLRFQTYDLLIKFKNDPILKGIKAIHCKVSPTMHTSTTPPTLKRQIPLLSQNTAKIVRIIAESLEDKKLQAALLRIAEHV